MSGDWRDYEPSRSGISVARLSDGETLTGEILSEPYREETEESENALHVPISPVEWPEGFTDMSGNSLDANKEYNIINSSSSFFSAMLEQFPEGTTSVGETVSFTAFQPEDSFSRYYSIEIEE